MPFSIRSYRRFPMQYAVTNNSDTCIKRPLSTKTVIRGVDLRSIEDTAVIELLLTHPERKVERCFQSSERSVCEPIYSEVPCWR